MRCWMQWSLVVLALAACADDPALQVTLVDYLSALGPTPAAATATLPTIRLTFSQVVDPATLGGQVTLRDAAGEAVPTLVSVANFANSVSVTPGRALIPFVAYTLSLGTGIRAASGLALAPLVLSFTVGPASASPPRFRRREISQRVGPPTALAFAPDGRLVVASLAGELTVLELEGCEVEEREDLRRFRDRSILGLAVRGDEIFVAHAPRNETGLSDPSLPPFSGMISSLTHNVRRDLIIGLPRSSEYHQVNGLAFGPDGKLYIAQGGNTNYGAPSEGLGLRPESPLSAAILVADVDAIAEPVDVGPGYVPGPVTLYATGLRNPYDLVWTRDGQLYATDNGGNPQFGLTPGPADGCPGGVPYDPGLRPDELDRIVPGGFYGHPNPSRGQCLYEGRGTVAPALQTGLGASSDGLTEYRGPAVGALHAGDLLFVNYAAGKSLVRFDPETGATEVLAQPLQDPIDVAVRDDGLIVVAELAGLQSGRGGLACIVPAD